MPSLLLVLGALLARFPVFPARGDKGNNDMRGGAQLQDELAVRVGSFNMSFAADLGLAIGSEKKFIEAAGNLVLQQQTEGSSSQNANKGAQPAKSFEKSNDEQTLLLQKARHQLWENSLAMVKDFWNPHNNAHDGVRPAALGLQELSEKQFVHANQSAVVGGIEKIIQELTAPVVGAAGLTPPREQRARSASAGKRLRFSKCQISLNDKTRPTSLLVWDAALLGEAVVEYCADWFAPKTDIFEAGKELGGRGVAPAAQVGKAGIPDRDAGRPMGIVVTDRGVVLANVHAAWHASAPNSSKSKKPEDMMTKVDIIQGHLDRASQKLQHLLRTENATLNPDEEDFSFTPTVFLVGDFNDRTPEANLTEFRQSLGKLRFPDPRSGNNRSGGTQLSASTWDASNWMPGSCCAYYSDSDSRRSLPYYSTADTRGEQVALQVGDSRNATGDYVFSNLRYYRGEETVGSSSSVRTYREARRGKFDHCVSGAGGGGLYPKNKGGKKSDRNSPAAPNKESIVPCVPGQYDRMVSLESDHEMVVADFVLSNSVVRQTVLVRTQTPTTEGHGEEADEDNGEEAGEESRSRFQIGEVLGVQNPSGKSEVEILASRFEDPPEASSAADSSSSKSSSSAADEASAKVVVYDVLLLNGKKTPIVTIAERKLSEMVEAYRAANSRPATSVSEAANSPSPTGGEGPTSVSEAAEGGQRVSSVAKMEGATSVSEPAAAAVFLQKRRARKPKSSAGNKTPIFLDMETGDPDDLMNLMWISGHPSVDLLGVTVTPGSPAQLLLVQQVLEWIQAERKRMQMGNMSATASGLPALGYADIDHADSQKDPFAACSNDVYKKLSCARSSSVSCGGKMKTSPSPEWSNLVRDTFKKEGHDALKEAVLQKLQSNGQALSPAAELMTSTLTRNGDKRTTLVTGGPVTNLASAIRRAEQAARAAEAHEAEAAEDHVDDEFFIPRWVGQGGFAGANIVPVTATTLPKFQHQNACHTWNFGQDPEAAELALSSEYIGQRVLFSKNVCHRVVFNDDMKKALQEACDGAQKHAGLGLFKTYMGLYSNSKNKKLHDLVAGVASMAPDSVVDCGWCEFASARLRLMSAVDDKGGLWGCDSEKELGSGSAINCSISVDCDIAALTKAMFGLKVGTTPGDGQEEDFSAGTGGGSRREKQEKNGKSRRG